MKELEAWERVSALPEWKRLEMRPLNLNKKLVTMMSETIYTSTQCIMSTDLGWVSDWSLSEGNTITMKLDTGASTSVLSKQSYEKSVKHTMELKHTRLNLQTFTGNCILTVGWCYCQVSYGQSSK